MLSFSSVPLSAGSSPAEPFTVAASATPLASSNAAAIVISNKTLRFIFSPLLSRPLLNSKTIIRLGQGERKTQMDYVVPAVNRSFLFPLSKFLYTGNNHLVLYLGGPLW